MINFTLKQLRYVDAVARMEHFGRAAEACAVSQPALSMQIKELEAALGAPLFERGGRVVRLTAFGEDFTERARRILRAAEELGDLARAARDQLAGRLRIGVIPTVAPYLLPAIIRGLGQHYPDLDIHVRETVTPVLLRELAEGGIDTALVALPVSDPGLTETPLFTETFVLVRPVADEAKPVPRPEQLRQMRLLLLEEGHCFRDQALAFCRGPTATPQDGLDGSSLSTLVQLVGAGIGVTLIPEMAAPVEAVGNESVSLARFSDPQPRRTIGMVWRKTTPLAGQLQAVADVVKEVAVARYSGFNGV